MSEQHATQVNEADVVGYNYINPNGSSGVTIKTPFGSKTIGARRQAGAIVVFRKSALGFSVTNR